ncbi:hypothetical protein GO002_23945 [Streptomyces eurocidicus]|nr:hypothetical protein [Streptomyces eurocidicus]
MESSTSAKLMGSVGEIRASAPAAARSRSFAAGWGSVAVEERTTTRTATPRRSREWQTGARASV